MKQHNEIRKTATKLVEVRLSALTRQEYMEVVEVPVDITLIELNNLVQKRYQAVDGGKFTLDPEYWEQSTCEAVDSDMPTAKASLVASRTAEGLQIVQFEPMSADKNIQNPTWVLRKGGAFDGNECLGS